MTPLREAVVLPSLFLTVALLGGVRIAEAVRLVPPSLSALVLAGLLLGTLVRGGAIAPGRLLHGTRAPIENVSGAIVVLCLFAASAQALNLVIPERGLLHAAFAIFVFGQLMTMNAAGGNRTGLLRSVLVLLASLFVLRYILVEALYAPGGGVLHTLFTSLLAGASLGGISYEPHAPITGYLAFVTLGLFMLGLLLLPAPFPAAGGLARRDPDARPLPTTLALVLTVACLHAACGAPEAPGHAAPAVPPTAAVQGGSGLVAPAQRAAALARAQVWLPPATPVGEARLDANPPGPGAFDADADVECRLVAKGMDGTTPKFDCEREGGDVIRVKYGRANPELYSEVATTRLLRALGFGADRVYVVGSVKCAGCPADPFPQLRCLEESGAERLCFPGGIDYSRSRTFEDVVIERRMEGRRIASVPDEGWAWFELDRIDPAAGGAPRAHVDALRLLAVFLAHWDNKAENQRLVCLPGGDHPDGGCARPLAMLQDVGASFGPVKLDLQNWRALPVWTDPRTCRVSMEHLPWGGGTFPERGISEEGRQFLLQLLAPLSEAQLVGLFESAGIRRAEAVTVEGRNPRAWAAAFLAKVEQIREAGPCPGT